MTILVSARLPRNKDLDPRRRGYPFERGLVFVSDSRLSFSDPRTGRVLEHADNGTKLFHWGRVVVGYASSSAPIAGDAILALRMLGEVANPQRELKRQLIRAFESAGVNPRSTPTKVHLGVRAPRGAYELWRLSNANGFEPRQHGGVAYVGSGAPHFSEALQQELEAVDSRWSANATQSKRAAANWIANAQEARRTRREWDVPVWDVAGVLGMAVRRLIASGKVASVGGRLQIVAFTDEYGPKRLTMELVSTKDRSRERLTSDSAKLEVPVSLQMERYLRASRPRWIEPA